MSLVSIVKRITAVVCIFVFALSFSSCDVVIYSLGWYKDSEFYISDGFQDYTVYAKYHYNYNKAAVNYRFRRVTEYDFDTINMYLDNFEGWVGSIEDKYASNEDDVIYDFDRDIIDTKDYFYIFSKDYGYDDDFCFYNYDVYFFDSQTNILYYFHNNI